ncbi:MAG: FtsX-like permease family protein, partial [Pseudomonadota bacterium]
VVVGDKVTLTTPPNKVTAFGRVPTRRTYTVAYIFQMGWFQYDNAFVFLPLDDAQGLLNRRGRVDGIEVAVENPDSLQRYDYGIAGHIDETSISVTKRLVPGTSISNWKDQNGNFLNALDAERASMFVILTLIILVAALNIISGLIMLVKEKGQNIGIMRTFGMTRGAVLRVFFICGSSIGVVGTILGVIAGLLFIAYIHEIQTFLEWMLGISLWPADVRGLSTIPTQLVWSDVYATVAVALSLSLLATWYPARRAARLDPVEALRYE